MNTIVYFVSSRTCRKDDNKYKNWLLSPNKYGSPMVETYSPLTIESSEEDQIIEKIYEKLISDGSHGYERMVNENTGIENRQYVIEIIKSIPSDVTERSPQLKSETKNNIRRFLDDFSVLTGLKMKKEIFKEVLKLKNGSINLYAVDELKGEDIDKLHKREKKWCDLIINFLLDHIPDDTSEMRLLLHDQDYELSTSIETFNLEECGKLGFISGWVKEMLCEKKITLDVSFFQHDNPFVLSIIGENVESDGERRLSEDELSTKIEEHYNSLLEHTGHISKLQAKAQEVWNKIKKESKDNIEK